MSDLTNEIKALEEQLVNLRRAQAIEQAREAKLTPEQRLAEKMHKAMCTWNHVDGCAWEYEFSIGQPDWRGQAHARWLEKATKLTAFCKCEGVEVDHAVKIFSFVKQL